MKKGMIIVLVIIGVVILGISWGVGVYNNVIKLEAEVDAKWAQIDNQLLRRSDLVPDLVKVANKYASTEKEIIQGVADARSKLAGATTVQEKNTANNDLDSALSRLLVVVENYPELKSNQNFRDLSVQLEGTENRIAVARQDYNAAVTNYNTKRRSFPSNIVASLFGFQEKALYKAAEGAKDVPPVDFTK
jgi:LemA protein